MGDVRYAAHYARIRDAPDPARALKDLADDEVVFALAAASREKDAYLANVLATEATNRLRRTTAAVQSLAEGILVAGADGRCTFVNPAAERLLKRSRSALIGHNLHDLVHGGRDAHDGGAAACPLLAPLDPDAPSPRAAEDTFGHADGGAFPVTYTASRIVDAGEGNGVVVAFRDVTDDQRVEDTLRERTRVLETLNRVNQSLAGELDLERLVQAVTDAGRDMTGAAFGAFFYNTTNDEGEAFMLYTLSGAPKEAFSKFPHPRNTDVFGPTFRGESVIRLDDVTKDPRYGNMPPYHGMPEGHLPVRSYLAAPVVSRSGEVIGGLFYGHPEPGVFTASAESLITGVAAQAAIAIDNARLYRAAQKEIAEREKTQAALEESEERYRTLVEHSPDAIIVHRGERIVYANEAAVNLFAAPDADALVGLSLRDIVHPEHYPRTRERMEAIRKTRRFQPMVERRVVRRDGTVLDVEVSVMPVSDPEENGDVAVQAILRDITARKRTEETSRRLHATLEKRVAERTRELTAANAELESFAYSVSHDLRAPLRGIDYLSQAILDDHGAELGREVQEMLDRIQSESARMTGLVNDILELSRASRAEFKRSAVDLTALAWDVVRELRDADHDRQVDVVIEEGLTACGDPRFLRVVLENLLGNAWKFTRHADAPRVTFRADRSGPEPVFVVRDNGAGFDMSQANRLFEAFQRLHTPQEFEGTGVGLATVKRVVQRHGGRVWAEGRPGKGATFRFTLPSEADEGDADAPAPA